MSVDAKICGITRPEDAAMAVRHGAWRLGVIFAWGPRLIDVPRARAIVAAAAGVPVIGVFGEQSAAEIVEIATAAGLRGAQLHRPATTAETVILRAAGLEVWRVAHLSDPRDLADWLPAQAEGADIVLLEPGTVGRSGGRGQPLDLPLARQAREILSGVHVALAGGLNVETVAAAIQFVSPNVVDVSSGIESAPGIKNPERLKRFLEIARDTRSAA